MSEDWLVRGRRPLELTDIIAGVERVAPEITLRADAGGRAVVLTDDDDRPVAWVCQSREVRLPLGTDRALPDGARAGDRAVWTEVVGPSDRTAPPFRSAPALLGAVARSLAEVTEGTADRWSSGALPPDGTGGAADAGLDRTAAAARTAARGPRPDPAGREERDVPVDVVTDQLAILVQSRPVLSVTPWIALAQEWAAQRDLLLVVLTPTTTAVTPQLQQHLDATGAVWIVDGPHGMYLGSTGQRLSWSADGFDVLPEVDPASDPVAEDRWTLVLQAETTHPFAASTVVGEFTRAVCAAAGHAPPTRMGLFEPPESDFDPATLTAYAKKVSPGPARLLLEGPTLDGAVELVPQPIGVVERVTLLADVETSAGPMDDEAVRSFVRGVLAAGGQVALAGYRRTTGARLVPARVTGPTFPRVVTLARSRFPTLGDEEALRLGGSTARLVADPVAALVVPIDLRPDEPVPLEDNPAVWWARFVEAVGHHDGHRHAARRARRD
ncbi:DUF6177 family protein [Nocardioides sp. CFH 31398]|uniref:DUF6177 family protein n=1 Tax=Nocardioides sp. CFH 31398 TaxID=2919579 RepID=UPI001F0626CB|nr:DUF6177 family protein [Nocardioides sp. CFH 31398]MCH1865815.1 DUF6177 family protein [Nocardioides sp. CFH 31398]